MDTGSDVDEPDVCALCLDSYKDPKFLPCHHTYCSQCIRNLAVRHTGNIFPCPACRKPTSLPKGGVAALQSNFYIKTQRQANNGTEICNFHKNKKLEFYCVDCDEAICLNCKLTKHAKHDAEDLHTAANKKKKELSTVKDSLEKAVTDLIEQVETSKKEKQALAKKKAAIEKNIHERHATILAAAEKIKDESLDSLLSVSTDIEQKIAKTLKQQEDNLETLLNIQRQVEKAVSSGDGGEIITISKEMRSGRGSEQVINELTSHRNCSIPCPVLRFDITTDAMVEKIQNYLGTVTKLEFEAATAEVTVVERFRCGEGADTEVFSLCPVDKNPPVVCVSYERCGLKKNAPRQEITHGGRVLYTCNETGKVTHRCYAVGKYAIADPLPDWVYTYSKSLRAGIFTLGKSVPGKAEILNAKVISTDPFKTEQLREFSIKVGAHRAIDVDDSEQFFAVVEEAQLPDTWRKVRLYRRHEENAISTYSPPTSSFQPSDVCFYKLGGQQMLLVTDELNDAIHVVQVKNGQMNFVRYLAPGCPLLIQPTAINVDVSGRLWLACRGGNIISMEPKA